MRLELASCLFVVLPLLSRDPTLSPHGTTPKQVPSGYPVRAALGDRTVAAEYMVRSIQGRDGTFVNKNYLVIEVAFYGPKLARLLISNSQFSLRINGKKPALSPQTPSFVAADFRYPNWEGPDWSVGAGSGEQVVIFGGPPVPRFPGDRTGTGPRIPRAPEPPGPGGVEKDQPPRADEVAIESALPEGELALPVSGYLYFAYKGKPKSIRSLELAYDGPAGKTTLKLL